MSRVSLQESRRTYELPDSRLFSKTWEMHRLGFTKWLHYIQLQEDRDLHSHGTMESLWRGRPVSFAFERAVHQMLKKTRPQKSRANYNHTFVTDLLVRGSCVLSRVENAICWRLEKRKIGDWSILSFLVCRKQVNLLIKNKIVMFWKASLSTARSILRILCRSLKKLWCCSFNGFLMLHVKDSEFMACCVPCSGNLMIVAFSCGSPENQTCKFFQEASGNCPLYMLHACTCNQQMKNRNRIELKCSFHHSPGSRREFEASSPCFHPDVYNLRWDIRSAVSHVPVAGCAFGLFWINVFVCRSQRMQICLCHATCSDVAHQLQNAFLLFAWLVIVS